VVHTLVLTVHCRSSLDVLMAQSRDMMEMLNGIRMRLSEQEASEAADIRTGE
jgi:hypothetical protein